MKKFFNEFKEFLLGSSFIDVAIGLLIAGAVSDTANAFVAGFVTPIIVKILSFIGVNPDPSVATTILGIDFYIQPFITALITFIIIMFIAFTILKAYAKMKTKLKKEEVATISNEEHLLTEIRDLLKQNNTKGDNFNL